MNSSILIPNTSILNYSQYLPKDIANLLYEPETQIIERIIKLCGNRHIRNAINWVKAVQDEGGKLTTNKDRYRTPGGLFFEYIKRLVASDVSFFIFNRKESKTVKNRKKRLRQKVSKLRKRLDHLNIQGNN